VGFFRPSGGDCEPGIEGVQVTLLTGSGEFVATTTTSSGGYFTFTNLPPGTYAVSYTLPGGYWFTTVDALGNAFEAQDSDANQVTGSTEPFVLAMGEVNRDVDAGLLAVPILAASKSSVPVIGSAVRVDDLITYTVWFTNLSQTVAFHVPVTDSAPNGTAYVPGSAVPPVFSGPSPLVWDFAEVLPGVPYSVSFAVIVTGVPELGTIVNVAFVGDNPVTETNEIVHVFVPTAIELISLNAARGLDVNGHPIVTVAWVVANEANTLGYRVLRSESPERSSASSVSGGIIAALGYGAAYAWVDGAALPGQAYYYWVQEIELDGTTVTDYGPAFAPAGGAHRAYLPVIQ